MVWLSGAGSLGIVYLLTQPYTAIFKVEQVIQLLDADLDRSQPSPGHAATRAGRTGRVHSVIASRGM